MCTLASHHSFYSFKYFCKNMHLCPHVCTYTHANIHLCAHKLSVFTTPVLIIQLIMANYGICRNKAVHLVIYHARLEFSLQ